MLDCALKGGFRVLTWLRLCRCGVSAAQQQLDGERAPASGFRGLCAVQRGRHDAHAHAVHGSSEPGAYVPVIPHGQPLQAAAAKPARAWTRWGFLLVCLFRDALHRRADIPAAAACSRPQHGACGHALVKFSQQPASGWYERDAGPWYVALFRLPLLCGLQHWVGVGVRRKSALVLFVQVFPRGCRTT